MDDKALVENQTRRIKVLRRDNSGEYIGISLEEFRRKLVLNINTCDCFLRYEHLDCSRMSGHETTLVFDSEADEVLRTSATDVIV